MAKRKKNRMQHESGAFAETGADRLEFDQAMADLARTVEGMDFASEEELSNFLNDMMTGKTFEEISKELGKGRPDVPESPLETANQLLLTLSQDTSYEEMRAKATKALEISPDCIAAHVILGNSEETSEKAAVHYEAAVKLGRELHADLIEAAREGGPGLWAFHEARDFMVALERLADAVHGPDEIARRVEILEEMILLNPSDNQGVRGRLLAEYFIKRRLDHVRNLLDRFPNDVDTTMLFGRPLLALVETVEKTGYRLPEIDFSDPEHFVILRKRLPVAFRRPLGLLEDAIRKNPSVALFSMEHHIMEVEIPDRMLLSGPYEAVEYLQDWGPVWLAAGLPIFLLQSYVSPKLLKMVKAKEPFRVELRDITEQLDGAVGESWIEQFLEGAPEEPDA